MGRWLKLMKRDGLFLPFLFLPLHWLLPSWSMDTRHAKPHERSDIPAFSRIEKI